MKCPTSPSTTHWSIPEEELGPQKTGGPNSNFRISNFAETGLNRPLPCKTVQKSMAIRGQTKIPADQHFWPVDTSENDKSYRRVCEGNIDSLGSHKYADQRANAADTSCAFGPSLDLVHGPWTTL